MNDTVSALEEIWDTLAIRDFDVSSGRWTLFTGSIASLIEDSMVTGLRLGEARNQLRVALDVWLRGHPNDTEIRNALCCFGH